MESPSRGRAAPPGHSLFAGPYVIHRKPAREQLPKRLRDEDARDSKEVNIAP